MIVEENTQKTVDYTTYPEGFQALAMALDMPVEDKAAREKLLAVLMKLLINN